MCSHLWNGCVFCTVLTSPEEWCSEEPGKLFGKTANSTTIPPLPKVLLVRGCKEAGKMNIHHSFRMKQKMDCCTSFPLLPLLFSEGTHLKIFANLNQSYFPHRSCLHPKWYCELSIPNITIFNLFLSNDLLTTERLHTKKYISILYPLRLVCNKTIYIKK